ncbi:MAG: hypothetical protein WC812_00985 [Candidatus Pacearchaeota archaeon]|jgi:RNase P/RNase MRP subunit p30
MDKKRIILIEKDFNKLRDLIKKNKDKEIIFTSEDDELNRKVIEKLEIKILLLKLENRKDFQKQRNSGFNQVMAKVMKNKKIKLGINLDELKKSKEKEKIIARIVQNIKLCNKNKIQMEFISEKEISKNQKYNLDSLSSVLGMPTWMLKNN